MVEPLAVGGSTTSCQPIFFSSMTFCWATTSLPRHTCSCTSVPIRRTARALLVAVLDADSDGAADDRAETSHDSTSPSPCPETPSTQAVTGLSSST